MLALSPPLSLSHSGWACWPVMLALSPPLSLSQSCWMAGMPMTPALSPPLSLSQKLPGANEPGAAKAGLPSETTIAKAAKPARIERFRTISKLLSKRTRIRNESNRSEHIHLAPGRSMRNWGTIALCMPTGPQSRPIPPLRPQMSAGPRPLLTKRFGKQTPTPRLRQISAPKPAASTGGSCRGIPRSHPLSPAPNRR
jgi:hypothetical protein